MPRFPVSLRATPSLLAVTMAATMLLSPVVAVASPVNPSGTPPDGSLLRVADPRTPGAVWDWPAPDERVVLRAYEAPATRYAAGHRGIDIRATGSVLAPDDGVVSFVGFVVDRPVLAITHSGGLVSSFEPVTSALASGAVVRRGDVVGTVTTSAASGDGTGSAMPESAAAGSEAHCGANCLHVGARRHGEYLSPLALFGTIPPAVLLPTRDAAL